VRFELDDVRMERAMSVLLRFGVVLASTLVLAGVAFYLMDHARQPIDYTIFIAHPFNAQHRRQLFLNMSRGDAGSIIEVGILFLVATPVARVIFAVVAFAFERDRLYTAISAGVLAVLVYGLLFGR
jgi:uncharacterized membrane protein